jgi:UDP-GlcNAc:undecaprenyl-phosphate GlcNAc-1-phosphate transferase
MSIFTAGLIVITALLLALLLVHQSIKLALLKNIVDQPDTRKVHSQPVPLLGGVGMASAFIITCLIFIKMESLLSAFLGGLLLIVLTGLADDIWTIKPIVKFTGEIIAALVFIWVSGYAIHSFGDLLGIGPVTTGRYAIPVTVFCMVGVMNAMNMADGMDGLAAGISITGCLFLGYFAASSGQYLYLALVMALSGGLLGFLYFNRYPARTFMGDSGSLYLGYTLSAICILLVQDQTLQIPVAPISMAIVLGLPIVDAILVMSLRIGKGKNPFHPDNTHLHHHLLALGLSHPGVVRLICLIMGSCGVLALLVRQQPEWVQFYTGAAYAGLIFGMVFFLQRTGCRVSGKNK